MHHALVTGGGGFVGRAIVDRLLARGCAVRILGRTEQPDLRQRGVTCVLGDVRSAETVRSACRGCDVLFHTAARIGLAGPYREFHDINVRGTENVVAACRAESVPRLVFTSSPSVVFNGRDMESVDESLPYPPRYHAHYPETKAHAERIVLASNDGRLATTALRPHLIWGPGDRHLVPRILARGRQGRLRRIGGVSKLIDSTYIDNCADAHLLAAERLGVGSPVAGRAYFISNGEPLSLWELVNGILAAGGVPPVTRDLPLWAARAAGACFDGLWSLLRLRSDPPMTRFLAEELATAHWFDLTAARRDLGYAPRVSIAEGLERLREWLTSGGNERR